MKNISKIFGLSIVFSLSLLVTTSTSIVFATTVSLSAFNAQLNTNQDLTVKIIVAPNTINYAEKVEIKYPANILEVKSFSLANGWMALPQPEYDLVDNVAGIIVKTAGYPSGLSNPTEFGTIIFRTKKTGSGTIAIGDKSLAFEANSQNTITGNTLTIIVNEYTPVATVQSIKPNVTTPTITPVPSASSTYIATTSNQNLAQVQGTSSSFGNKIIMLITILIAVGILYFVFRRKNTENRI